MSLMADLWLLQRPVCTQRIAAVMRYGIAPKANDMMRIKAKPETDSEARASSGTTTGAASVVRRNVRGFMRPNVRAKRETTV